MAEGNQWQLLLLLKDNATLTEKRISDAEDEIKLNLRVPSAEFML